MEKEHHYISTLTWTGNLGEGTVHYKAYQRDHSIQVKGKPPIDASSDPSFRGSPSRYNPEELLLSSISSCHMLWYLHLCSVNEIVVVDYRDEAEGRMMERLDGSGYFKEVILHPVVTLRNADAILAKATALHDDAHKMCFIANSCNFPIRHQPIFQAVPHTQ